MNKKLIQEPKTNEQKGFTRVFITTFTTVFLAELGDKTQIATLLLTAQSGKPLIVFIGAALALICSSVVGVLLGRWLSRVMPAERFNYIAGLLMVGIGLLISSQSIVSIYQNLRYS
ncbi:TMEM165/GDT1 family protein [Prochlorococcus sp. MIT 1307]|uniref:TMEM165/GDT1 family protein n=1 Tax=Prochlorococcus sp. MIT 1307 TaxID=3096219 RepID=UPI002A75B1D9|nr:TMEM165/GDT1 family protein [Prochlorococcus sp. MIT 1307]